MRLCAWKALDNSGLVINQGVYEKNSASFASLAGMTVAVWAWATERALQITRDKMQHENRLISADWYPIHT